MEMQNSIHSQHGLENHRSRNVNAVYWNLSTALLYEKASRRREGRSGTHAGRLPNNKFIVDEPTSADKVGWSKVNRNSGTL